MVLYLIFTLLLMGLVVRAIDWYPAYIARGERALVAAAAAQAAGDENAWQVYEDQALSGMALLRDFCGAPPQVTGRALWALLLVLLIAGWFMFNYGASLLAFCWLLFGAGLVLLAFVDAQTKLLPDALTLPLLWLGVVMQLFPQTRAVGLEAAIWGVLAGYVPLWFVARAYRLLRGRDGLGMGDLKLLATMGAWSGALVLPSVVFLASLLGIGGVLCTRLAQRPSRPRQAHAEFPFGPWLIAAYMLCLTLGFNMWKL